MGGGGKESSEAYSDHSPPAITAMKSAPILIAISLLAAAVHGSVAELELRATGGYVQVAQGTASFTQHSGCSRPGKQLELRAPQACTALITLLYPRSMWPKRHRLHGRDQPAYLRCSDGPRRRGRVRTLLRGDRQRESVLAELHGPIQDYRLKGHKSLPLRDNRDQRGMVQPDARESCQRARHVGAVRARSFPPLCQ